MREALGNAFAAGGASGVVERLVSADLTAASAIGSPAALLASPVVLVTVIRGALPEGMRPMLAAACWLLEAEPSRAVPPMLP